MTLLLICLVVLLLWLGISRLVLDVLDSSVYAGGFGRLFGGFVGLLLSGVSLLLGYLIVLLFGFLWCGSWLCAWLF